MKANADSNQQAPNKPSAAPRPQANAGIRDGQLDPVAAVGHLAHPQGDLALFRELTGIAQQIEQNLLEPHGVRVEQLL
jgi:hypothetical protein